MGYSDVIREVVSSPAGSRDLDVKIAKLLGWRRAERKVLDPAAGKEVVETLWLRPSSNEPGKVPVYTGNLQAAFELAEAVSPHHTGGCAWEEGAASASLGGQSKTVQAATPALALSAAALLEKVRLNR